MASTSYLPANTCRKAPDRRAKRRAGRVFGVVNRIWVHACGAPVRDSSRFLDLTLETCGRTPRTRGRWLAAPRLYGLRSARPAGRCGPQDGLRVLMGRPAGRNGWDSMRTRPSPAAGTTAQRPPQVLGNDM